MTLIYYNSIATRAFAGGKKVKRAKPIVGL